MTDEFQLIERFFRREQIERPAPGIVLGIGDDCALLQIPTGKQLAVSVDTLVADIHFPHDADPELIAERALRTNLSDLAAMGADPLWFTLALTLPKADAPDVNASNTNENWVRGFSRGLFQCADEFDIALVGGDTTSGPLSITIQVMGAVEPHVPLRRDGANLGDFVLVTHTLGDGAAALAQIQREKTQTQHIFSERHIDYLMERFYRPVPRLHESRIIREWASAAIDVSDGLVADLGHICQASDLGAVVDVEALPLSAAVKSINDIHKAYEWALSGGDDYELCFTVAPKHIPEVARLVTQGQLVAKVIGRMVVANSGDNPVLCEYRGQPYLVKHKGYNHFSPATHL